MLRRDSAAAGDLNFSAFDDAEKSLAGELADMRHWQHGDVFVFCRGHDGGGQRMLRILLEAADELHHFHAIKARGTNDRRKRWPAIRESSCLIEDECAARINLFQDLVIRNTKRAPRRRGLR